MYSFNPYKAERFHIILAAGILKIKALCILNYGTVLKYQIIINEQQLKSVYELKPRII